MSNVKILAIFLYPTDSIEKAIDQDLIPWAKGLEPLAISELPTKLPRIELAQVPNIAT